MWRNFAANKNAMQKNLVIVESPAKAKTIEKFLGEDFKVMSSFGHIRDLDKKTSCSGKEGRDHLVGIR